MLLQYQSKNKNYKKRINILLFVLAREVVLQLRICTFFVLVFYIFYKKHNYLFFLWSKPPIFLNYIPSSINRVSYNPSVIPWLSGNSRLASHSWHICVCQTVSLKSAAAAAVALAFSFSRQSPACMGASTGLYPGGGVWVWVRMW